MLALKVPCMAWTSFCDTDKCICAWWPVCAAGCHLGARWQVFELIFFVSKLYVTCAAFNTVLKYARSFSGIQIRILLFCGPFPSHCNLYVFRLCLIKAEGCPGFVN